MSFSFSFSGDDIEDADQNGSAPVSAAAASAAATTAVSLGATTSPSAAASAFPVQGKPQLPPLRHYMMHMLRDLPSKIAYGLITVKLEADFGGPDGGNTGGSQSTLIQLPRRELWDVRMQVMAEEDESTTQGADDNGEIAPGLGSHDVKTGIYEGGFKSWESSVDLVKTLLNPDRESPSFSRPSTVAASMLCRPGHSRVIEWACATRAGRTVERHSLYPLTFTVADYNPSVLNLVTLPNLILVWALQQRREDPALKEAFDFEQEELHLTTDVKTAFCVFLQKTRIGFTFMSGGWSSEFVRLLYTNEEVFGSDGTNTLMLGAETIYSPFALASFSDTLLAFLRRERGTTANAAAVVAAKKLYFGVGGSLDDFVRRMRDAGALVTELREETEGVRRGVVRCVLE
ncbi:hypothetical protein CMQ_431 [Grosmannia clavigera kw1407]|uniref:Uncharacterized protein n=1 Tax=Grosmannia clavigera (strain kw1407 / UAMH 11150) TaxID=655863 RepID=F0XF20_GROCL|nr:uncharacterized protein CMQ_431 [Grosmannia clavigera kw1407]EFX03503.1 hypothetical protein CMQ_431 [Grosmannia clavigera kw1407]